MSESKPASVVFTNGRLLAKNAHKTADNAKSAAEKAQELAYSAQKTADGKNRVFRGSDPATVPTSGLKEGDLYFTDNAVYTWTGSAWEKTVSDTTGAEIHAKVDEVMKENQKSVEELRADIVAKTSQIDADLSATTTDLSNVKTNLEETKNSLTTTVADLQKQTGQQSGSLSTANSKIEYNTKAIAEVKHTAEEISTTVSNLHAGDRNLARGVASSQDWFALQSFNNLTNYGCDLVNYSLDTLKAGDKVTFGITVKNEGITRGTMRFQQFGDVSQWTRDYGAIGQWDPAITDCVPNGTEKALTYTITITDGMLNGNGTYTISIRTDNVPASGKLSFKYAFVKKGTMATDWTPAPEDTDQAISKVSQTADTIRADLTNTQGDVSTLQQTANSLNAYVKESRGSSTLASILSMDPNSSSIAQVVNGQIAAAIGTYSDGTVRIDGKALHINAQTKIDDATIKSAMIESIEADQIKSGTLDASQIRVINLDANSITTGSLSAALYSVTDFTNYSVSATNPWDFNYTKSPHGNWFLNGETTADHVYNGPKDVYGNKLTPYMYVTSRGSADGTRFTVTVWKDNDPTQYQRVWNGSSWSDWVMLPNSQNIVSAINLSPDSVKISGKNIELNGDTTINGQLNLLPNTERRAIQFDKGYHNPWDWHDATVYAGGGGIQLKSTIERQRYSDGTSISGLANWSSPAITTLAPTYLKFTVYRSWNDFNSGKFTNQLCRTYIDAGRIETNDVRAHKVYCDIITSKIANTVSSRLSVKTDITPVSYDRALAAVMGTEMYDYRYVSDDSGQHYVSGIIDDVNPNPQYHMDAMLINKERTARIDANLVGYHHVVIQKLLERVADLEEKVK
ncbi:gp58-like family protein [Lactobacillus delbrueckii]|uniref:gp58-like family protein n=1 Tax=Lactobacillus delbrueckii TaxID=1584 RepID=UPI001E5D307B|nr:gp58-like family protein [Lactobacillus delbrueckii]MCD5445089.1 gp58-like family protein [Lactobacillus delbrueckii subsp. lactis]